jgi:drug/metabolite transporter (DMT)-like permease
MSTIPLTTTAQLATATTIIAEIAMSLHPILIKQLGVNLPTQLLARLGLYSILGTAFSGPSDRKFSWGSTSKALQSMLFGFMNLIHIASSYISYSYLPAGSALALYYISPFFNILLGWLFLNDTISIPILCLMTVAFLGVLLISNYTKDGDGKGHDNKEKNQAHIWYGIGAALTAAFTESLIFLIAKSGEEKTAWLPLLKLYPGAFLGILAWIVYSGSSINTDLKNWIPLILFNSCIGFLGYSLRFWSLQRLTTSIFSILTFIGVAAGYGWGLLYAKEIPSAGALAGAFLITVSIGLLKFIHP